ncbi:MAG: SGNH/GDSL hydrolase family protein [Planctomycetota bacterium]|jgi:lysophospholipase L1-like esterase
MALKRKTLFKLILILFGLGVGLVGAEIALRVLAHVNDRYEVWPAHYRKTFTPDESIMPGVTGPARLVVNSLGLRGGEAAPEARFKILALGGSTTECLYLDADEQWPGALEKRLNHNEAGTLAWVGNGGRSGMTLRDNLVQAKYLLPRLKGVNTLIVLAGCNDLALRLQQGDAFDPQALAREGAEAEMLPRVFSSSPVSSGLLAFDHSALYTFVRRNRYLYQLRERLGAQQDAGGVTYRRWREARQNASRLIQALPDLRSALEEYGANLRELARLAREAEVRLILLTQPALWKAKMPPAEEALLWMGGTGTIMQEAGQPYYSAGALAEGLRRYNATLKDVATGLGVEVIDLAAQLPSDTTVFYDDVHFNESGAARVAELVATYLTATPMR